MNLKRSFCVLFLFLSTAVVSHALELGPPASVSGSGMGLQKTFEGVSSESVQKFSVSFKEPFTGKSGEFTALNIEGCTTTDRYGYWLPVQVITLDIPKGTRLYSAKITGGQWRTIAGEFSLPPSPFSTPPLQDEGDAGSFLPGTFIEAGDAAMAGGTIVSISIFPIQYNPKTKKAIFLQKADIEISCGQEANAVPQVLIPLYSQSQSSSDEYSVAESPDSTTQCIIITPAKYLAQANTLKAIQESQPLGPSISTRIFTTETIAGLRYGETGHPILTSLPDGLSPEGGFVSRSDPATYPNRTKIARSYNDRLCQKIISFLLDCHDAPNYEGTATPGALGYYSMQYLQYIVILGNAAEVPPGYYVYSTATTSGISGPPDSYDNWVPTDFFYSACGNSGLVNLTPHTGVGRFPIARSTDAGTEEIYTNLTITALSTGARTITVKTNTEPTAVEAGMTVVMRTGEAANRWLNIESVDYYDAGGGEWNLILTLSQARNLNEAWMTTPSIAIGNTIDIIDTRDQMTDMIAKVGAWVAARSGNNDWFKAVSFAGGASRMFYVKSATSSSSLQSASYSSIFGPELSCVEAINRIDSPPSGDGLSYVAGLMVRKYFATDINSSGGRLGGDLDLFTTTDVGNILSNNASHRAGILYFAGFGDTEALWLNNGLILSSDLLGYGTSTYNNLILSLGFATSAFDEEVWSGPTSPPVSFGKAALLSPAGAIAFFGPTRESPRTINWSRTEDGLITHYMTYGDVVAMNALKFYHRGGAGNVTVNWVITKALGEYYADNPGAGSDKYLFKTLVGFNLMGSPAIYLPSPGTYPSGYENTGVPTAEPLSPDRVNSDLVPCYEVIDGIPKPVSVSYSSTGASNEITLVDARYYVGDDRTPGDTSGTYSVPSFDDVDSGASDTSNGPGLYFVRVAQKEMNVNCYTKETRYYFEVVNKFELSDDNILLVDDDQPRRYTASLLSGFDGGWQASYPDYETDYYVPALNALSKTYKIWHVENKNGTNAAGPPNQGRHGEVTQAALNNYIGPGKAVIWFTGNDWFTTILSNERTALTNFLNAGGKLFLTGQDIGYELRDTSFYQNVLRAQFAQDNIRLFNINGIAIDDLSSGLQNITISGAGGAQNQMWPSEIDPQGGSSPTLLYFPTGGGGTRNSTGCAGIKYSNQTTGGALVYFSFGFEAINHPSNAAYGRSSVLNKVLTWLGSPTATGLFSASPGDGEVYLTWTNPDPSGYPGVLIFYNEGTGYPTGVPADGTTYNVGDTIAGAVNGTVIYSQSPAGTSYTHTGLTNGQTYYYVAYVFDGSENYVLLGNAVATPQSGGGPGALPAPTNLIATSSEVGGKWQIDLSWQDNSPDEDGFEISRRVGAGAWVDNYATVGAGVESYTDDEGGAGLTPDTLYTYRVRAFKGTPPPPWDEESVWSNEASAVTSTMVTPTNLSAVGGEREVFLYWKNNSPGATGFEIQRSHLTPYATTHNFVTVGNAPAGAVTYRDALTSSPNIPDGRPYYYRIRAYDLVTQTEWSEIAWTNPIPSAFPYGEDPSNLELLGGWNNMVVRFNDNTTNESSYVVEVWKAKPSYTALPYATAYLGVLEGATWHETSLTITSSGTYYIRLIAYHKTTNYGFSRYATIKGGSGSYAQVTVTAESGDTCGAGNCFIATAAWGTPYERNVQIFRRFRDKHLLTNRAGRAFVRWYYSHSPSLADYIRSRPAARAVARTFLRPLAWLLAKW